MMLKFFFLILVYLNGIYTSVIQPVNPIQFRKLTNVQIIKNSVNLIDHYLYEVIDFKILSATCDKCAVVYTGPKYFIFHQETEACVYNLKNDQQINQHINQTISLDSDETCELKSIKPDYFNVHLNLKCESEKMDSTLLIKSLRIQDDFIFYCANFYVSINGNDSFPCVSGTVLKVAAKHLSIVNQLSSKVVKLIKNNKVNSILNLHSLDTTIHITKLLQNSVNECYNNKSTTTIIISIFYYLVLIFLISTIILIILVNRNLIRNRHLKFLKFSNETHQLDVEAASDSNSEAQFDEQSKIFDFVPAVIHKSKLNKLDQDHIISKQNFDIDLNVNLNPSLSLPTKKLYKDNEFGKNLNFYINFEKKLCLDPSMVQWKRPHEIVDNPKFIIDGIINKEIKYMVLLNVSK